MTALFPFRQLAAVLLALVLASSAQAARINLQFTLDAAQSGGGGRTGSGTGIAVLDLADNTLHYQLRFSGLSGTETVAHFHGPAAAGVSAAALYTLPAGSPKSGVITLSDPGSYPVANQIDDLLHGLWYVNVHSSTFPGGEIRGQLAPQSINLTMNINGSQEVPPRATSATGTGTAVLNTVSNQISYNITFSGLTSAETAAHFHGPAAAGVNAAALYTLPAGSPKIGSATLVVKSSGTYSIAKQITDILSNLWYVNIHTTTFTGGEIRGQLIPATCTSMTDFDCDGTPDASDAFRIDPSESLDTDGDSIGNNEDTDDDNDGTPDASDAFPLDPAESVDTDLDGIGNNTDHDDDGDGVVDSIDTDPLNPAITSEITLPLDNSHKGARIQEKVEVQ